MLGNNIKVHFAGAEQLSIFESALTSGVKYNLFTVFHFICDQFGLTPFPCIGVKDRAKQIEILKAQVATQKHTIMDSGIFTLQFGAKAGHYDMAFIERWTEALCRFVLENGIHATCVEVDAQKVLGPNEAWIVRERMRKLLPDRKIINVFHMEDGKKGLDRLIEYADYLAVSVPEYRFTFGLGKKYEDATIRIYNYIKNKKPQIDLHLLGCTSKRLLQECRYATSADSTSWQSVNRYGKIKCGGRTHHISAISAERKAEIARKIEEAFYARGIAKQKTMDYYAAYAIAASCCLRDYTEWAGNQQ